ncbi:MAG: MBL fold metallo-hydrolase [Syntrophaceae bacterium]|nr:MBL fold metallo-hydrolase [Syntrophaceae bacterium]
MKLQISWLGHSSVKIKGNKVIYIDPWKIDAKEKADLILVSHSHSDHFSPGDIKKIYKNTTVVMGPEVCVSSLGGDVRSLKAGAEVTIDDVTVQAVPAYNINKSFHPRESGGLGFVIGMDGQTIYYGGDTDRIPEMDTIRADVVILPVGGIYTMTADEAAEAVNLIKPRTAIPIHFGDIVGSIKDAERFEKLCRVPVTILPVTRD